MIDSIQLLRNIGKFDSVNAGAQLPFSKLTLLYAENGRGKTTLAAMFRSLRSGAAEFIRDRHRLAAANPPHIVVAANGGSAPCVFQNGTWSHTLPDIVVFDDRFVSENVCSGIEVETGHRQNLHELILGAQGVTLNATVQTIVARIEAHNPCRHSRRRSRSLFRAQPTSIGPAASVLQAEKLLQPRECGDAFSCQDRTHQPATVKYVEARTDFEIP